MKFFNFIQTKSKDEESEFQVYVSNLSFNTNEENLKNHFSRFYPSNETIMRRNGRSEGFGFVDFFNPQSAKDSLQLNGFNLDGRNIRVELKSLQRPNKIKKIEKGNQSKKTIHFFSNFTK